MSWIKVYVKVRIRTTVEGVMIPKCIYWEDGKRFKIDKVIDIKHTAAVNVGGCGDRFTIQINGKETYLFYERIPSGNNIGRWFVERKGA